MNYFEQISAGCDELNKKANEYMSRLPFMTNDVVIDRLWKIAVELGKKNGLEIGPGGILLFENLNWDNLPEWAANALDGWMPYTSIPRNGSLHFSLGFSVASMEAHLRNLLEVEEGREENYLDFPVLAPLPEIEEEKPVKKVKKKVATRRNIK